MSKTAAKRAAPPGAGLARVLSDERLTKRAIGGDESAFAAIFDRYHQRLYRYCLAILGDSQDAQDALQNTMVKVLRALPGEERRIELKPWLYRIAHNESIELLRRRRDTRQLDGELAAPGSGLAADVASRERLRRLISDLDELPERQRATLVMRELAGLDFAAIGTALGTSAAVARQTLYEARMSLRQMDEGREMSCDAVTRALSDGDGRIGRRRDLRAHLRGCAGCRRFSEEIAGRKRDLAALSPLPAVAAAGLLQGLLGGGGSGGGLAGALGGGAAKSLGSAAALKGAATVAVVAAIGVGAADRGGLIDVGPPGGDSRTTRAGQSPPAAPGAAVTDRVAGSAASGAGSDSGAGGDGAGKGGGGQIESSQAAKPGAGATDPTPGDPSPKAPPTPTSPGNAGSHPQGKGHGKQLPSASEHGQQTAAAHKAEHGSTAAAHHPAHPSKPSHPAQPANPSAEKQPPSPPSGVMPGTRSQAGTNPPAAAEEGSAAPENGKKP